MIWSDRRWAAGLLLLSLTVVTAGTAATPAAAAHVASRDQGETRGRPWPGAGQHQPAQVVAAVLDTGINPYHEQFRDRSPLAHVHPSKYLTGFPPEAEAIHLTLHARTYEEAVQRDRSEWDKVEPGELYWIPGTRIVGAITFTDLCPQQPCTRWGNPSPPWKILDRQGHGTMTASRLAGESTSLCPECRIVAVQLVDLDAVEYADELFMPELAEGSLWVAQQPWIDVQSNSWGHVPHSYPFLTDERAKIREAARRQATFFAGGNGLYGFFGVTGHPAWPDNAAGVDGVITVGAHDNGKPTLWSATLPHVVADGLGAPALGHETLDKNSWEGAGGTSGSTPFAAGAFAAMILEARRSLGDPGTGTRGTGTSGDEPALVVAAPGTRVPSQGPLQDGRLTLAEAKLVYLHTANSRPVEEKKWDGEQYGDVCNPLTGGRFFYERFIGPVFCTIYVTAPLSFDEDVPEGVPTYYFVGYGQSGEATLGLAHQVLRGETAEPNRATEDEFFKADASVRRQLDEIADLIRKLPRPRDLVIP